MSMPPKREGFGWISPSLTVKDADKAVEFYQKAFGFELKDSFLATIDPQGLVKRGNYYYSTDWDEADRQVDIDVDAALGKVSVVWVR